MPCYSARASVWRSLRGLLAACVLGFCAGPAMAHKSSDAYLQFDVSAQQTRLRWDIAFRDLDAALDIDADGDGELRWDEIQAAMPRMRQYAEARLTIPGCALRTTATALEKRSDGAYLVLYLESGCSLPAASRWRYTLFAEVDPTHRGIAKITRAGQSPQLVVLDPTANRAEPSRWQFVAEGVRHILGGYDHVLFLICLLLPVVMRRGGATLVPVERWKQALLPVLAIVSAFTLAHSITLGLAASQLVSLPPSLIEPAIALTIMLAAFDNVWPIFRIPRAMVVFAFGLVHGFGFAGVLAELNLPRGQFGLALLEFNLGLELGQVLIVCVAIGVLFTLRNWPRYTNVVIRGGSLLIFLIATLWLIERITGGRLPPF